MTRPSDSQGRPRRIRTRLSLSCDRKVRAAGLAYRASGVLLRCGHYAPTRTKKEPERAEAFVDTCLPTRHARHIAQIAPKSEAMRHDKAMFSSAPFEAGNLGPRLGETPLATTRPFGQTDRVSSVCQAAIRAGWSWHAGTLRAMCRRSSHSGLEPDRRLHNRVNALCRDRGLWCVNVWAPPGGQLRAMS